MHSAELIKEFTKEIIKKNSIAMLFQITYKKIWRLILTSIHFFKLTSKKLQIIKNSSLKISCFLPSSLKNMDFTNPINYFRIKYLQQKNEFFFSFFFINHKLSLTRDYPNNNYVHFLFF